MVLDCSSIVSLLFLLLIIHWTHTYTLRSADKSLSDHEYSQIIDRLRRWNNDNDEIEIPLNETLSSVNHVENITILNSIENSTLFIVDFNSTIDNWNNLTTTENNSIENITMIYPILKQDLVEDNQTNSIVEMTTEFSFSSTIEEQLNTTSNETMSDKIEIVELNTTVSNTNETTSDEIDEFQTSSILSSTDSIEFTTIINQNQTSEWHMLLDNSSTIPNIDEIINDYILTRKDALIINQDIYQILLNETVDNATEMTTPISISSTKSIPICDRSCQCLKQCPYGFEILNDTCQCHLPCQNYQCYGNDTCIITDEGKPFCRPENGTQHDRPSRCYQPRDAGYHDENLRYYNRWYYNPDQDACHMFVYRGLGGNENNFLTLHECHLECITCAPLPDPGECLGHITMWYFDKNENICREFQYSGCKGNDNRFLKKEQCIDACIHRIYNL